MNNRFSFKDFVLFVLLAGLVVVVLLAMKQYDRQWKRLTVIERALDEQTREMTQLRRTLQSGIRVGPATSAAGAESEADVFAHAKRAQAKSDYALGDWYVDVIPVKIKTLTPYVIQDVYGWYVNGRVVEWMLTRDPYTLEHVGLLANSWQQSEDGLKITFQLRRGITFSDGVPFTADDVVFSFEWVKNPAVAAPRVRSTLDKVLRVEKTGDHEVVFHLTERYYEALDAVGTLDIIPKHFYSRYTPEQFNTSTGLVMGTGPYKFRDPTSWKPGQPIELVRNERYWGEPGPWEKMVWHEIEAETASLTMFRNGEVDAMVATPEQFHQQIQDPKFSERSRGIAFLSPNSGYNFIAWNQKRGGQPTVFADKRVRQAMTMLLDRDRLLKEIWYGYGNVSSGPFSPTSGQLDPGIKPWPFDIARGKALLKEAGLVDRDGDGILESASGAPFRFKFTFPSKSPLYERIMLFLKDSYARAGIVVELDPVEWPIMMKRMEERDYDATSLGWSTSIESDLYQIFHSSQIADQGDNFVQYVNPELDKAIHEARTTVDKAKRMPLWHKCHQLIHEDQPYTFLIERKSLWFMDKRIANVEEAKLGLNYHPRYVMPIPWYVAKGMQKWK